MRKTDAERCETIFLQKSTLFALELSPLPDRVCELETQWSQFVKKAKLECNVIRTNIFSNKSSSP
jgi:hypothetical protein